MGKFQTGDVLVSPSGCKWEVLASHVDSEGEEWYWMSDCGQPFTVLALAVKGWRIKPTFFEEQASYRSTLNDEVITVCFVHQMAKGFVAVAQSSKGEPHLMHERHFRFWEKL